MNKKWDDGFPDWFLYMVTGSIVLFYIGFSGLIAWALYAIIVHCGG